MFGIRRRVGWGCGGADILNVRLGGVFLAFVLFGICGIGVSGFMIVVNSGEGTKEEAVDISQNGSAARGNAIGGKKAIDIGEGEVDALGGLKILGPDKKIVGEVARFLLFQNGAVMATESGLRIGGEPTALTA
jgi:hypothetical protein